MSVHSQMRLSRTLQEEYKSRILEAEEGLIEQKKICIIRTGT